MEAPPRHHWPAVLLAALGVVFLLSTLVTAAAVAGGLEDPYRHTVEATAADDCAGNDAPVFEYADLSPAGQATFEAALAAPDGEATTAGPVEEFAYRRPPPASDPGRQYVRFEGDCYELVADAGFGAVGQFVVVLVVAGLVTVGGVGGGLALAAAALSYRLDPRIAPATLALVAGLGAALFARLSGVAGAAFLAAGALAAPAAVWWWLTRRGWADRR